MEFKDYFDCLYTYLANKDGCKINKENYLLTLIEQFMENPLGKENLKADTEGTYNPLNSLGLSALRSIYNGNRKIAKDKAKQISRQKDLNKFAEYIEDNLSMISNDAQDAFKNRLKECGILNIGISENDIGMACADAFDKILQNIFETKSARSSNAIIKTNNVSTNNFNTSISNPNKMNANNFNTSKVYTSNDNPNEVNANNLSKDKLSWKYIWKKYEIYLEEHFPILFSAGDKHNIFLWFRKKIIKILDRKTADSYSEKVLLTGILAAVLRCFFYSGQQSSQAKDCTENLQMEIDHVLNETSIGISVQLLIEMSNTETLGKLSKLCDKEFYKHSDEPETKNALALTVFIIFFTDLYLVLTKYSKKYMDIIKYKTNADICRDIDDFHRHIRIQEIPFHTDMQKRRLDICMSCDDANAHKIAVLLVNEFERALGGFEDIFSHIGFYIYYIRAQISAIGQDHIKNYNFETYAPTLIPLLSGGHLYNTRLVFIRELVQNAIDSIYVRNIIADCNFSDDIKIELQLSDKKDYLSSLTITDHGMGMGSMEIERYLTSIGRSFYTAGDFKKLNLSYKPISHFGIGFLSCFLVSKNLRIHTHKLGEDCSYELFIPNIEGCFFIEKSSQNFPEGVEIFMDMDAGDEEKQVSLIELLEYADLHLLDIGTDIIFSWNGQQYTKLAMIHQSGENQDNISYELMEITRMETHAPPCAYAFLKDSILTDFDSSYAFQHNWWNKYLRGKLMGISLKVTESTITSHRIPRHCIRLQGKYFFIFIPFRSDGEIPVKIYNTIESTYDEPYGIFITDEPFAGKKMRNKSNGISSYSGKLLFLNAGILVDEGTLKSLFGQDMRIYLPDMGTAYNNVIFNFPPDWIRLNIARDKIMGFEPSIINKKSLINNIAQAALENLKYLLKGTNEIPLVNIQEIANLMSFISVDLQKEGKNIQTELKRKKFLLWISCSDKDIDFEIKEDFGENIEMAVWFQNNFPTINKVCKPSADFISDRFFKDFENQLDKKDIESIDELDTLLQDKFKIPQDVVKKLKCHISILLFAIYILYFPENRISKYANKASHSRLALEWQLIKKYTTADFKTKKTHTVVNYDDIFAFLENVK